MHQKWFTTFFLVFSNLSFLVPCIFALASNYYLESCYYASNFVYSSLYHLCKADWIDAAGDGGYCFVLGFETFKGLDFFFAQMVIPITFFYFTSFDAIVNLKTGKIVTGDRTWLKTILLYWFSFFNAFMILSGNEFNDNATVLILSSATTVFLIAMSTYLNYDGLYPKFHTTELLLGLFFSLIGISLMLIQDHVSGQLYWFIHSKWHVLASVGQTFLIISKKETFPRRKCYYNDKRDDTLLLGVGDVRLDDDECTYAFISYPVNVATDKKNSFSRLPYRSVFRNKLKNLGDLFFWIAPVLKE